MDILSLTRNVATKNSSDILILSDTHSNRAGSIPDAIREMSGSIDLILHAGDITSDEYLAELGKITDVIAVRGNMDQDFRTSGLPETVCLNIHGWSLGLVHGRGAPDSVPAYAHSIFSGTDLIVFGHSHFPFLEMTKGSLLINPGSLSFPRNGKSGSYALLNLTHNVLECRILTKEHEEITRFTGKRPV